jgi:hypothetical protein
MRNVLNESSREDQNTHFVFSNFFSENRAIYERMSNHLVEPERSQMTIWRRVACWISKATRAKASDCALAPPPHTHTELCNTYCFLMATVLS